MERSEVGVMMVTGGFQMCFVCAGFWSESKCDRSTARLWSQFSSGRFDF